MQVGFAVPPPTRRCTRRGGKSRRTATGSSAHAEMHPAADIATYPWHRFLRPRGDAPEPSSRAFIRRRVPPPTRRCTRSTRSPMRSACGSSAHAEMHPTRLTTCAGRPRFLRPRGDAPVGTVSASRRSTVPPPTRRCTRRLRARTGSRRGSSAHAEMHLHHPRQRTTSRWFLRPRGDAPGRRWSPRACSRVPPPTRRCTAVPRASRRVPGGSSAHAEMHRPTTRTARP